MGTASEAAGAADSAAPAATSPSKNGRQGQARLATTALLFQAPEPSSTPRRAQRGASDPVEAGEETPVAETTAPTTRATSRASRGKKGSKADSATPADAPKADEAASTIESESTESSTPDVPQASESGSEESGSASRRRRRGGRGRRGKSSRADESGAETSAAEGDQARSQAKAAASDEESDKAATPESTGGRASTPALSLDDIEVGTRRRRRRGRGEGESDKTSSAAGEVTALKGSTRLEAKRQRRREGRDAGRRRTVITEAEFLARRESVERTMVVRQIDGRTQIAVIEDGVLVEHYVSRRTSASMVGNVYLGRVQNVLPSMEAAFVDVGKGRNAVLYAGEVNWDAAGMEGQPRRIEQALSTGDSVLVQVTKDPIGHKGARLTSQITLAGRYLVFVPGGGMTGISRKLPETERNRLKKLLKEIVPEGGGVIVRTAAEGASEAELRADIERLTKQWERIEKKQAAGHAPQLLQGEPDLELRVVRDIFNEDFASLTISGDEAWETISGYIEDVAPDLASRLVKWTGEADVFAANRIDEQLAKGMDRKVWLPSGGSLVIDRTEAMTVIDVNTGKFTGAGGTLEETVTKNNLEAAEEIVRQLRLRDIGGIIVVDFIDMVLESNRDLVLRRLVECLSRDRTRHQVAEVTSLGLVQMTRKRVGQGLVEAFSEPCDACGGRGFILHDAPVERTQAPEASGTSSKRRRAKAAPAPVQVPVLPDPASKEREAVKATLASIAAAAAHAHDSSPKETPAPATPVSAVAIEVVGDTDASAEFDVVALIKAEKQSKGGKAKASRSRRASSSGAASGAPEHQVDSPAKADDTSDTTTVEAGEPAAPAPAVLVTAAHEPLVLDLPAPKTRRRAGRAVAAPAIVLPDAEARPGRATSASQAGAADPAPADPQAVAVADAETPASAPSAPDTPTQPTAPRRATRSRRAQG